VVYLRLLLGDGVSLSSDLGNSQYLKSSGDLGSAKAGWDTVWRRGIRAGEAFLGASTSPTLLDSSDLED